MCSSLACEIFSDLHEMCVNFYDLYKSIGKRYRMYIYKKRGFKGYDYNIFNLVRGLKVKKYIIMLLLSLTFVVSFNVSASGVGNLEIEPLYEPTMTFENDSLGKFNYDPFLRRLKTDVLENNNNFLDVTTNQFYENISSGGDSTLVDLSGSKWFFNSNPNPINSVPIPFISDYNLNLIYTGIIYVESMGILYAKSGGSYDTVWTSSNGWVSNSYRYVTFQTVSPSTYQPTYISYMYDMASYISGGTFESSEIVEEKSFSLLESYSRNQNFTHSKYWGITSNYVFTNNITIPNDLGVDSLYLNYSDVVLYDEFVVNYAILSYSLIPTSIIIDVNTVSSVTWEWNYKVQTDIGLTEVRSVSWSLSGRELKNNTINVLPHAVYDVSNDDLNIFMNTYGQNQFIYISSANVTIDFISSVDNFDIVQYSVDSNVYNESNELSWYDFDSQGSVSNLGESLLESANNFLQLEIFPNFRILDILLIAIAIPMLIWVLKVFFGG